MREVLPTMMMTSPFQFPQNNSGDNNNLNDSTIAFHDSSTQNINDLDDDDDDRIRYLQQQQQQNDTTTKHTAEQATKKKKVLSDPIFARARQAHIITTTATHHDDDNDQIAMDDSTMAIKCESSDDEEVTINIKTGMTRMNLNSNNKESSSSEEESDEEVMSSLRKSSFVGLLGRNSRSSSPPPAKRYYMDDDENTNTNNTDDDDQEDLRSSLTAKKSSFRSREFRRNDVIDDGDDDDEDLRSSLTANKGSFRSKEFRRNSNPDLIDDDGPDLRFSFKANKGSFNAGRKNEAPPSSPRSRLKPTKGSFRSLSPPPASATARHNSLPLGARIVKRSCSNDSSSDEDCNGNRHSQSQQLRSSRPRPFYRNSARSVSPRPSRATPSRLNSLVETPVPEHTSVEHKEVPDSAANHQQMYQQPLKGEAVGVAPFQRRRSSVKNLRAARQKQTLNRKQSLEVTGRRIIQRAPPILKKEGRLPKKKHNLRVTFEPSPVFFGENYVKPKVMEEQSLQDFEAFEGSTDSISICGIGGIGSGGSGEYDIGGGFEGGGGVEGFAFGASTESFGIGMPNRSNSPPKSTAAATSPFGHAQFTGLNDSDLNFSSADSFAVDIDANNDNNNNNRRKLSSPAPKPPTFGNDQFTGLNDSDLNFSTNSFAVDTGGGGGESSDDDDRVVTTIGIPPPSTKQEPPKEEEEADFSGGSGAFGNEQFTGLNESDLNFDSSMNIF